jgi:hypothetical protein
VALYESLHCELVVPQPRNRSDRIAPPGVLSGPIRFGLFVLLLGLWMAGAYAGIVYWALNGSLLGVILSVIALQRGRCPTFATVGTVSAGAAGTGLASMAFR